METEIYVLKGSTSNLLGICELRELNLFAVINALCDTKFDPLEEFKEVFEGLGTMPGLFKIKLKDDFEPVRLFSPRPIAAGLREQAKLEIDGMLASKVIEPVEEPTDWCSGLTIAPKKGGKIRMCVDLTGLNKGVKREVYPLPRVSDLLCELSKGTVFSKLDANSGFWQVEMDPECKSLTTFITPWGRFRFNRMPFGISSAPEFFQREMEKIVGNMKGVICLMDDILVYGKDANEHWLRLKEVLKRVRSSGMTLKKDKCEFGSLEIKFLGHIVSGTGIKPDPSKVEAILNLKSPVNKTEARRFTGMVNYLSKFSKQLAELCIPIYKVSGKASEWFWGVDQEKSFECVKSALSKAPVLCGFDLNKKHRVSADASKNALGAVLLQLNNENEWQPVEYASRKMTEAEGRYAMIEKEALAITWACEKFDYYLVGRLFEIETDHKPLISILGEKDLSVLPVRVQRFKLRMMRYDYLIFHTPGKDMYLADSLSRPNNGLYTEKDLANSNAVDYFVNNCAIASVYTDSMLKGLSSSMLKCGDAMKCIEYVQSGWPESSEGFSSELCKLYSARDWLTVNVDLLYYRDRVYIPVSMRNWYLRKCHVGHQGITKCRRRAQSHFWWPGLNNDIANYISKCNTCIVHGTIKHQPMVECDLPSKPWEVIGSDVFILNEVYYLLMVDYYSRWIEALPISDQTSKSVITVMKKVFSVFGIPNVVRSDNGRCYDSREFREFSENYNFQLITSSPRYPQSNGMAESAVGTVKKLWRKESDKEMAMLVYRTTPLPSGYSPSELMFGRPVKSNLGVGNNQKVDYNEFELLERERKLKIKNSFDKKYRVSKLPVLQPGQAVYVNAPTDIGSKGVVVRKDNSVDSYWVKVGNSEIRRNRKHLFALCDGDNLYASSNTNNCSNSLNVPNNNIGANANKRNNSSNIPNSANNFFGDLDWFNYDFADGNEAATVEEQLLDVDNVDNIVVDIDVNVDNNVVDIDENVDINADNANNNVADIEVEELPELLPQVGLELEVANEAVGDHTGTFEKDSLESAGGLVDNTNLLETLNDSVMGTPSETDEVFGEFHNISDVEPEGAVVAENQNEIGAQALGVFGREVVPKSTKTKYGRVSKPRSYSDSYYYK